HVSYAQSATATPIPIATEGTDDSAAPIAPDISPPEVDSTATINNAESTIEPEATAAIGDEEVTEAPIDTNICPIAIQDSFTAIEILCSDISNGEACIGNGTVESVFGADVGNSFSQANDRVAL